MSDQARHQILARLKSTAKNARKERPPRPVLSETGLDKEQALQRFTAELTSQTGTVYTAESAAQSLTILAEMAAAEGLKTIIAAGDAVSGIDLKAFGAEKGITVLDAREFKDREGLREAAFTADAGVTWADFAVAETGTIGLIFREGQPRLASIAPPVHIAIIPQERLYPVYENAIEKVFGSAEKIPSQFSFITGPSSTGDIQAVQFKGMHGPVKVMVIIVASRA